MVAQRTFSEFMEICEAKVPVTRQAGDFRYSGRTGEEKAERRANVLSKSSDPARRRQANTIRSRIKTVADRDTARASSDARQNLYRGQQRRANDLAQQLMKKEEVELDEVVVTRSSEVKQRAKNIKKIRDKKDALAALMKHAKLQKQGIADEVEYDGENVDEILMVSPSTRQTTKKVAKKITKIEKPDPKDPDYVVKQRAYLKAKQRQEAIDYERMRSGAEAASERAAAVKKAKLQRQQSDAESARTAFRTKGVPFSDAKGSGHIVNGKKVYAS